jgi:hypothetical protein
MCYLNNLPENPIFPIAPPNPDALSSVAEKVTPVPVTVPPEPVALPVIATSVPAAVPVTG